MVSGDVGWSVDARDGTLDGGESLPFSAISDGASTLSSGGSVGGGVGGLAGLMGGKKGEGKRRWGKIKMLRKVVKDFR